MASLSSFSLIPNGFTEIKVSLPIYTELGRSLRSVRAALVLPEAPYPFIKISF